MAEKSANSPRRKWIEPVVAVLMALTTLCTAWCSYESAAWTRRSNRLMNESNSVERGAALLDVQGSQALIIHASMFMQLLAAQHAGNEQLASFYAERFPPDVKKDTVLFATVLFFAGTAGKFEQPRVRLSAAVFGVAVFLFAVVRMLLMPAA